MIKKSPLIDSRNAVLIAIVLLVAGYIGFWVPYRRSQIPPPREAALLGAEVKVEYTERGFEPATITVPVGTTVAWKKSTGGPMWVSSDPHPAHTELKGFDQRRVINRAFPRIATEAYAHGADVYEYTFSQVGTWKYHNHVNPRHRGTVVVVDK